MEEKEEDIEETEWDMIECHLKVLEVCTEEKEE